MLEKILKQINEKLNDGFFPEDLTIEDDRFFTTTLLLSKQECLFLKNVLEDLKELKNG